MVSGTAQAIGYSLGLTDRQNLDGVLQSLRQYATRQHFRRNEVIFAEGDLARTIYRVVNGTVRLCRHTARGRRHIAEFLLVGESFGVAESRQHALTAEAVAEVILTAYPKPVFDRLVADHATVQAAVLAHMADNLAAARHHQFVLSSQNAKERVMSFLVRLATRGGFAIRSVELPMGRQDIADHLGLTIESVSRAIGALKTEGAISAAGPHRLILNGSDHRDPIAA